MADEVSTDPAAYIAAGRKLLRKREFANAAKYFNHALELNPINAAAHEALATASFLQKDFEQAAHHFRESARCDARRPEPLINLGAVLNKLKDFKGAIDALQQSLRRQGNSAEAYYNLGLAYRGSGQAAMAVSAYKEAIRLKPDFAEAYQNLGNAYLDQKNYRQATSSFNRALELNPDLVGAKRGLQKVNASQAQNSPTDAALAQRSAFASGISAPPVVLSEIQRAADREIVNEATKRIERSLLAWITEIHSQIEPSVKDLNRALINGEAGEATSRTTSALVAGIRDADELSRLLREARVLLQEHEEDILGTGHP